GNDVRAVSAAAADAASRARSGGGATLIECRTYRTRPHAEGMGDFTYRTREEVESWKSRCPIARLKASLSADEVASVEVEVRRQVEDAQRFAESSPWPDPATAADHVYANDARPAIRARSVSEGNVRSITFMQATLEALSEEMAKNPVIFVMGEGIGQR